MPAILALGEVGAVGSGVQGYPGLCREFKTSLGYNETWSQN